MEKKKYLKPTMNVYKIRNEKILFSVSGIDEDDQFSKSFEYVENDDANLWGSVWDD